MTEFRITDIFPKFVLADQNGFAMAKAIEAGLKYFNAKAKDALDVIQNPEKMPEWRLDEMAWEYNCLYDYNADIDTKREWIKNALGHYLRHGTAEGIRQYLRGMYDNPVVEEAWQYGGDPYHFRLTVDGEYKQEYAEWIRQAAEKAKNVRSVLDVVIFNGGNVETETAFVTAVTGLAAVDVVEMIEL